MSTFNKDGLCKHQKGYADCGECRATVVRTVASVSPEEVQKDWDEEDKKREHITGALRAVMKAREALSDALAHIKLDTLAAIPANAANEIGDCQYRLRILERDLMVADSNVLRAHLNIDMIKRLRDAGETELAEGFEQPHE